MRAGPDPVSEQPECLVAVDLSAALPRGMAVAGMYLARWRADADAELDDPVRGGWSPLFALPPFGFSLLACGDLLPDPVEGCDEPGLQGSEAG